MQSAVSQATLPRPQGRWSGEEERFLTLAEYDAQREAEVRTSVSASEVLVLVLASKSLAGRAQLIEEAWATSLVQRIFLVDDWIEGLPRGKQWHLGDADAPVSLEQSASQVEDAAGYWGAQSRQLAYMRMHPNLSSAGSGSAKWAMLADDDTWVHVEALLRFVMHHNSSTPVLFSYVLSDAHVLGYDYPCGGAGMLLSQGAYDLLAPQLLTPACPMLSFNDLTLGYCAYANGVPVVHHPHMHCSPDINRAMRPGENVLDLQQSVSVHRLPAFQSFTELVESITTMQGQATALQERGCMLTPRAGQAALDSRRFFWTADAFVDLVATCRNHAPNVNARDEPLHLAFVFYGSGTPVHRYHRDRQTPQVAAPHERNKRWPEWLEQLRHSGCMNEGGMKPRDTWVAHWIDAPPRISRRQVMASDLEILATASGVEGGGAALSEAFKELERQSPRGSWLEQLQYAVRTGRSGRGLLARNRARSWIFLDFAPTGTFVNVAESMRHLRLISDMHVSNSGLDTPTAYASHVMEPIHLGAIASPPLALAYEYSDLNIEPDAGVWLNGLAAERLLICPPLHHPIALDPQAHGNDWETESERLALLWHNLLAVDVFRTLRFCGVLLLHAPRMVPHGLSYLPYSTFRRVHAPSVATALTIGNTASREQVQAMSLLVRDRSCVLRRPKRRQHGRCPVPWRPPFRMRLVGSQGGLAFEERHWSLPGARFLGMARIAFRSEHFLPDAQAVRTLPG